jgi:hypothetical protein
MEELARYQRVPSDTQPSIPPSKFEMFCGSAFFGKDHIGPFHMAH